ncbi:cytochrome P450 716B1-like [Oryza glaberrima]|uniref:Cytochrome P450 n=1 Tax=Oryza glaberrima TaxID=4538 RepID=I1QB66_ORYGL|nr:cytochrome P450 716B1-like [Oryza glaberrima]
MALAVVVVALLVAFLTPLAVYLAGRSARTTPPPRRNLPPGSLGLPLVGQSLSLLRAMRRNTAERWLQDRIDRYGPVSKLSLFGAPTVLLAGPAANKAVFLSEALAPKQPRSLAAIIGRRNMLELVGDDHRRVRGALAQFLRPEMLRRYVGRIDGEVRRHLAGRWAGRRTVAVLPLMKLLTLDVIATLLFGLARGAVRERLAAAFADMLEGLWAVPLDLPFTAFRRSLRASARARRLLAATVREKKANLEQGESSPSDDLISYLVSLRDGDGGGGRPLLTEEEIIDNSIVCLTAGHDTSAILLTFMVRHLADDPATLAAMVQEHEEIARSKRDGEALTWEDVARMKLTWRVAQETLRMVPPVFGSFRRALEDVELDGGYVIPKGWQVFWAPCVTHMDPAIYHDPDKFDPSRFDAQAAASAPPPYSFVAFGGGPRICPGMELARVETLVTMHYLVRHFRWRLCCGGEENTFVRDPLPSPANGLPVELDHIAPLRCYEFNS